MASIATLCLFQVLLMCVATCKIRRLERGQMHDIDSINCCTRLRCDRILLNFIGFLIWLLIMSSGLLFTVWVSEHFSIVYEMIFYTIFIAILGFGLLVSYIFLRSALNSLNEFGLEEQQKQTQRLFFCLFGDSK